jgi:hypothetical protein
MPDAPVAVRAPRAQGEGAGPARAARRGPWLAGAWLAAAALAGLLAACVSRPPPDTDATAETAQPILLTEPRADELRCDGSGPDCADWFRFRPSAPGTIRVSVAPRAAEGEKPRGDGAPLVPFELTVLDESGATVGQAVAAEGTPAEVSVPVRAPGAFLASVKLPPKSGRQPYELRFDAQLRAAPPPATKTRRWTVLEVESGAQTSVVIDGGRRDALRAGLRGRLLDGDRTLGRVVVVEVFEEGARARVEGPLAGAITPDTVAEIEVPPDGR